MIDVAFTCATDLSHQHSLFVSPEVFREVYMPYYKRANNWIHENTNWKILKAQLRSGTAADPAADRIGIRCFKSGADICRWNGPAGAEG